MFEDPDQLRPQDWRALRMVKLRQMAGELRSRASRRPPLLANTLRQRAVELELSANRIEDVISHPA
ncbi:MAG: hypothetical protein QOG43_2418 [Actinomycetota bacterium]|jgi:hypothetical protein|nr:hypothetical protein [Actinomycetota bacterium]